MGARKKCNLVCDERERRLDILRRRGERLAMKLPAPPVVLRGPQPLLIKDLSAGGPGVAGGDEPEIWVLDDDGAKIGPANTGRQRGTKRSRFVAPRLAEVIGEHCPGGTDVNVPPIARMVQGVHACDTLRVRHIEELA